jgi:hypothetical protein
MVALATASAAASNTESAECMYLLVMLCFSWPSNEISGETGEAPNEWCILPSI